MGGIVGRLFQEFAITVVSDELYLGSVLDTATVHASTSALNERGWQGAGCPLGPCSSQQRLARCRFPVGSSGHVEGGCRDREMGGKRGELCLSCAADPVAVERARPGCTVVDDMIG